MRNLAADVLGERLGTDGLPVVGHWLAVGRTGHWGGGNHWQARGGLAHDLNCKVTDLLQDAGLRKKIDLPRYVTEEFGLPTLNDIIAELARPGRDPRRQFEAFSFQAGVEKIEDIKPGMKLPGIVTNVTAFGAFVDVGVH